MMARQPVITDRSAVSVDTPLRLAAAAALAFPDGSMTVSGLRRERDAGRLETWITAGKEYTSLAATAEMTRRCREARSVRTAQVHRESNEMGRIALGAALSRCARR